VDEVSKGREVVGKRLKGVHSDKVQEMVVVDAEMEVVEKVDDGN